MFSRLFILAKPTLAGTQRRLLSDSTKNSKRYLQTINQATNSLSYSYVPLNNNNNQNNSNSNDTANSSLHNSWNKHSLPRRPLRKLSLNNSKSSEPQNSLSSQRQPQQPQQPQQLQQQQTQQIEQQQQTQDRNIRESNRKLASSAGQSSNASAAPRKRRRQLKPRKALITLTSNAINHLKSLMDQPNPQYIKVGVKNRGCSGLSYHLEYVSKPEKFDEVIKVDDNVQIIIDSKALFSIIGSEMDYVDDKLSSRFVFKNPNSKGSCGCGESFMV